MSTGETLLSPALLRDAVSRLLGPTIAVAGGAVSDWAGALLEGEGDDVARASPVRRQEFSAGRTAARDAMAKLGYPPVPLRRSREGPVIWPPGLTGSISHGGGQVLAAVGRTGPGLRAIGIDLEPLAPLSADLALVVCRPDEDRSQAIRIFGAKEAAYKAQFPLTRSLIDFPALRVTFRPDGGFRADFMEPVGLFGPGDGLAGHQALLGGILVSVVRIGGADDPA